VAGTWANQRLMHGIFWLVVEVPRGPVMGCHVAPRDWFVDLYKICWSARGSNPRPIDRAVDWQDRDNRPAHGWTLSYKRRNLYLSLDGRFVGGEKGRGLAPALETFALTHDHITGPGARGGVDRDQPLVHGPVPCDPSMIR
jgi:hypothetical protein